MAELAIGLLANCLIWFRDATLSGPKVKAHQC